MELHAIMLTESQIDVLVDLLDSIASGSSDSFKADDYNQSAADLSADIKAQIGDQS